MLASASTTVWPTSSTAQLGGYSAAVSALTGMSPASPEARLIEVYRAIGRGNRRRALALAEALTRSVPNFQLGQLVYGDLLLASAGPRHGFGAIPRGLDASGAEMGDLREEARRRLAALRELPPPGAVPQQVLELALNTRHVVAVDASHSRVYVFEHRDGQLHLLRSHYASIGRAGFGKSTEGDLRTPLGVYYITSRLDDSQLDELYGVGALPLNYPNEHDRRLGKTGSGIWLHGVPRASYSRSPYATEGCVALANDDMGALLSILEPRRTPVIIAEEIHWVQPQTLANRRNEFRELLQRWSRARAQADLKTVMAFYSPQFRSGSTDFRQWGQAKARELATAGRRFLILKDLSILAWKRESEVTLMTFAELRQGDIRGPVKRQYWARERGEWKIFFEGVIG
ncbi:MAG: hypothetical protein CVU24_00560 [Betaproteobacteria bacterium HGW-Betaproteobacteria-18]|nr:MAG: hypothetical protein CVU24_00560 [Betaproteobacteria bacterium HGW-Betaproteobacteria-18]